MQMALLWAVLTMCCWGVYGPILGRATGELGGSRALAMALIGAGYGILGVRYGWILLKTGVVPDKGNWNRNGFIKGSYAGALGVGGNFSLIMALMLYHRPEVVMPLVFAGAPVVNSFFAMWWLGLPWSSVDPRFWLGLVVVAFGGYLVLTNKPDAH